MIDKLENNPNVATLTYPDGMVEYFDSNEEFEDFIKNAKASNIKTYAVIPTNKFFTGMNLKIYEDLDFQGEVLNYYEPISVPDMRNATNIKTAVELPKDFNDKVSSFQLIGNLVQLSPGLPIPPNVHHTAVVVFYRNFNYESKSKSFMIDTNNPQVSHNNFRKIKFNDKPSSLKLYWVN